MAKLRPIKTNFTNGEVDPLITMRSDLPLFQNGAAKMRNALPFAQGGFSRRPGLEHLSVIPTGSETIPIGVVSADIDDPGLGYVLGETISVVDGISSLAAVFSVVGVSSIVGGITAIELLLSGDYTSVPTSSTTTSSGAGTGATLINIVSETQDDIIPISFSFSITQNYLIVFSISRFYVFRQEDTGSGPKQFLTFGNHVYSNQQLLEITTTQSLDRLLIFHKDVSIRQIIRVDEVTWNFSEFEITNIPSFAFGEIQNALLTIPVTINTKVGDIIVIVASAPTFSFDDVGSFIRVFGSGTGETGDTSSFYKIIAFNVSTSVDAEVLVNPLVVASFDVNGISWLLEEPDWSFIRGYPRCGTFFQGRLCLAGSRDRPGTFWASRSGNINDFNNGGVQDDLGIVATADTGTVVNLQNIYPGRHLQILGDSAEFYVPISEFDPITPNNFSLRRTTSIGSVPSIPLFDIDGIIYFVQRGGGSLRQFVFDDNVKAYTSETVSLFSSHLIREPLDVAYKQSLNTEDGNYVWVVNNDDGSLAAFNILSSQLINAWSLQTTTGTFHHVAVVDQTSYFHIQRVINGQDVDSIEFFNTDSRFDAGVIATNLSSDVTVVSELDHLEGESVGVIVDNVLFPNGIVSGGSLTLPETAKNSYEIGLTFPDIEGEESGVNVLVETLPSDIILSEGSIMGKKKRVVSCTVRFVDTQGFYLQNIIVPFRNLPEDILDSPIPQQSGQKELRGLLGWNEFGQIKITQKEPLAMTVLGLAYDLATGR